MVDGPEPSIVELAGEATDVVDPGRSLAAIAELRRRLDELEEFQVENALRRGWSWGRIGRALGRTRQALHKRYSRLTAPGPRPGRIVVTGEARRAVALARDEARRLGARTVGVEHLLLGLVAAGGGPAGLDLESAREAAARLGGSRSARGDLTASARRALEQSLRECLGEGRTELRPEHLLRAVLRHRRAASVADQAR